jgi:C1A family cysteine protease
MSPKARRITPRKIARYGWIPDLPDSRDYFYAAPSRILSVLPPYVDLRPNCPAVYDQGDLGSCTANAIGASFQFEQKKQGIPDVVPSRLFIYYNERVMEGTVNIDSGAMIRDGMKSVSTEGAPPEELWPYNIAKFRNEPPEVAYDEGQKNQVLQYRRVNRNLNQMKGCLATGYPFVFGFSVYESFESQEVARTGVVPMPGPGEQLLGGHAVMAVGYDDSQQRFTVRNSWGENWGMSGYFTMPYAYLTQRSLSSDFWTTRLVESGE